MCLAVHRLVNIERARLWNWPFLSGYDMDLMRIIHHGVNDGAMAVELGA